MKWQTDRYERVSGVDVTHTAADRQRPTLIRCVLTGAVGAVLLACSVRMSADTPAFYLASLALAATWALGTLWAVGGLPIRGGYRVPETTAVAALGTAGAFLLGGYVAAQIPLLDTQVHTLVAQTDYRFNIAVVAVAAVTGIAEELFFRGALFEVINTRRVLYTTLIYTAVTAVTANIGLILAAAVLGAITGFVREYTGSVLPPVCVHLAWTLATVGVLPVLL